MAKLVDDKQNKKKNSYTKLIVARALTAYYYII